MSGGPHIPDADLVVQTETTLAEINDWLDDLFDDDDRGLYTRERFDADRTRLLTRLCAKHGIEASEVDALIRDHRYEHSEEDPEDEYISVMTMGHAAGWLDEPCDQPRPRPRGE